MTKLWPFGAARYRSDATPRAYTPRCARSVGVLATLLMLAVPHRAAAQVAPALGPDEHVVGVPWTGTPGTTETVAEIVARERRQPQTPQGPLRPAEREHEHVPPARRENPAAPAVSRWPKIDAAVQAVQMDTPLLSTPQTLGTSFLAIQSSESGFIPPDSMGAVGPTQILACANGRIKLFSKTGVLGSLNVTVGTFFNSVRSGSGTSDPQIRYDRLSGRWFVVAINIATPNRVLLAVSSGPTITDASSFTFFQFRHDLVGVTPNSDSGGFADYPTLGVDRLAVYIGANIFNGAGTGLIGTTGFVVNKSDLLAGTLTVTAFRQLASSSNTGPYTPQGVDNDDPAATEGYFIGVDWNQFSQLDVRRVSTPGGVPSISGNLGVSVPTTSFPLSQPASGSTVDLDAIDDRLMAAAIHKNKITGAATLWTAHTIRVNSSGVGGSGGDRNASRWYEIQDLTSTPTLRQSGTLFDAASSSPRGFWMSTVAMSGQGHMALGCSTADSAHFAEIAVAGRLSGDALGATQAFTLAQTSTTAYNVDTRDSAQRWGDYSHVVVDPNDDMTMWTFQEYCRANNSWGVRAIQLAAPPPAQPASASPASVENGRLSVDVTITATSTAGSAFFDPGADTGGPGFANHIAASIRGGVTVNGITFTDATHVTVNISTVGAMLGAQDVTVTNPDGQSSTGSALLTITGPIGTPTDTPTPPSTPTGTLPTATPTPTETATATPTPPPHHDAVVLPVKPVKVTVPVGKAVTKKLRVKVVNADTKELTPDLIKLMVSSDCPGGVSIGTPDFIPTTLGADDSAEVSAGHGRTAVVPLTVHPLDFANKNHLASGRCTLTFTASTQVLGNTDPTLSNNTVTVELNVVDKNVPEVATAHESLVSSLAPLKVKIAKGRVTVVKQVRPKVTNADILPTPEVTGDAIQVTMDLSGCIGITADMLDMDARTPGAQDTVQVRGGAAARGLVRLTVAAGAIATASKISPVRCTAVVSAAIAGNTEPDSSNNVTRLVIDVVDMNDL